MAFATGQHNQAEGRESVCTTLRLKLICGNRKSLWVSSQRGVDEQIA